LPLNIKNADVERLAAEVSKLTGESKTEAVRKALEERRERLSLRVAGNDTKGRLQRFLVHEVWPTIPKRELGRRLKRKEEESILGYGKHGV
jgi:antitoxin VapB